ncbi:toprim domain-containing protein [Patescibacteria group bacterium]|nr:toprim domain-containing protein [Patescibacteria group bacterium]
MTTLDKLIAHFERFPGIGSRQAKRFAFHLLRQDAAQIAELSSLIAELPSVMAECEGCARYFSRNGQGGLCPICASTGRDRSQLLIIEQDSDIQPVERSGYEGLYFVLGGTVPLLHQEEGRRIRGPRLKELVNGRVKDGLTEIILGFAVNPDGENTARYVEALLAPVLSGTTVKLSHLGRGLSTGSELEYADPETIKSALKNRD